MEEPQEFRTGILCAKCGQDGVIVWERTGTRRSVISISDGFYRRMRGNHSAEPAIICDACGTPLKSHALSLKPQPELPPS